MGTAHAQQRCGRRGGAAGGSRRRRGQRGRAARYSAGPRPARSRDDPGGADGPPGGVPGGGDRGARGRPDRPAVRGEARGGASCGAGPRDDRSRRPSERSTSSPPGRSPRSPAWSAGAAASCGRAPSWLPSSVPARSRGCPSLVPELEAAGMRDVHVAGSRCGPRGRCHYRGGHDARNAVTAPPPSSRTLFHVEQGQFPDPFHVKRPSNPT